ncbi:MAG: DUF4407 domain-containing protein [archaeon]|nr:DUF4407 domain-containing protein [archaeon]
MTLWGFGSSSIGGDGLHVLLNGSFVQGVTLITIGVFGLVITGLYLKDKNSSDYKLSVMIGTAIGIVSMVIFAVLSPYTDVDTLAIALIGSFALAMRFPRNINFPVILTLLASAVAYISLDGIELFDPNGWPRIVVALLFGTIVYVLLRFLQEVASILFSILSCWPIFAALAVMCVVEGVCILSGHNSIIECVISFFAFVLEM